MQAKEALRWFESLSAFQHGAFVVTLPFVGFAFLFLLLRLPSVPSGYVAVASFLAYGLVIPCVVIYVLGINITEKE
jgi:hypothetical protein